MKIMKLALAAMLAAIALVPSFLGCGPAQDAPTGSVNMKLTGITNGTTYRLRNARFNISGASTTVLDSETDPTLAVLSATLPTGSYSINLQSGYALEKLDAMGGATTVQSTLISPNPVSFQIISSSTTNVVYQFATNGTVVTIGTGTLNVGIQVTETSDAGSTCSVVAQTGCSGMLACYLLDSNGATACMPRGNLPVGAACDSTQANGCAPPAACATTDPTTMPRCIQICDPMGPNSCMPGMCVAIGIPGVGACL
jgi:hypothetical protein